MIDRSESRLRRRSRPHFESIEARLVPATLALAEFGPNETLGTAQDIGVATTPIDISISGGIAGDGTDVDWYSFRLDRAARVNVGLTGTSVDSQPMAALYNANPDPYDFGDPNTPTGHRVLTRSEAGSFTVSLAAGTYFVAISGSGNNAYHPYLAGSGVAGKAGLYRLTVTAEANPQIAGDGPMVLATSPNDGDALDASPFVVRVDFDRAIEPGSIALGANVRLLYHPTGDFGDGAAIDVPIYSYNYSAGLFELQLTPAAALAPGFYRLDLVGDPSFGNPAITDVNGIALGTTVDTPLGRDASFAFEITGIEGSASPNDDTAATARDLGVLDAGSIVRVSGAIGDDPYYDPTNPDLLLNRSADIDLYRFQIVAAGHFAVTAELFGGRIGSSLDGGLSLYRVDSTTGQLQFVAGNNNTRNNTSDERGGNPLFVDPLLHVGLDAGVYFVAVSTNYNTPTPIEGGAPGVNGIFDVNVAHSGSAGFTTGPYILSLMVRPVTAPPTVVTASIATGAVLAAAPTAIKVTFSEPMNLRELFFLAFERNSLETVSSVFVEASDGTRYFPRLESANEAEKIARFGMLARLPNGTYELHLSGPLGLTDLAGQPLAGNDPSGDFVIAFTVAATTPADPLYRPATAPNDTANSPQDLGAIFPHEWQAGVTVERTLSTANDAADYFAFEVLQNQVFAFNLETANLGDGFRIAVLDMNGQEVPYNLADGRSVTAALNAGRYLLRIDGWSPGVDVAYTIKLVLAGALENATPLSAGPAPATAAKLANNGRLGIESGNPGQVVTVFDPVAPPASATTPPVQVASALPTGAFATLTAGVRGGVTAIETTVAANWTERIEPVVATAIGLFRLVVAAPVILSGSIQSIEEDVADEVMPPVEEADKLPTAVPRANSPVVAMAIPMEEPIVPRGEATAPRNEPTPMPDIELATPLPVHVRGSSEIGWWLAVGVGGAWLATRTSRRTRPIPVPIRLEVTG